MPINRVLSVLSHSSRILTTHLWLNEEEKKRAKTAQELVWEKKIIEKLDNIYIYDK